MFKITEFFIKNSLFIVILSVLFFIFGIFSFFNLKRNEDPGFKIRTAVVTVDVPGLSADEVDNLVTKPIERKLFEIEEIENLRSESYYSKSVLYADLYENVKDIQPVWDRLRRKIEDIKDSLPDGASVFVNDEFSDVFGILIGVQKEGTDYEELYDLTRRLQDELTGLQNAGRVQIFGFQKEALYIYFKNSYLSNLKLTPNTLKTFINAQNAIKGGGFISGETNQIQIDSSSRFFEINDIKNAVIANNGNPLFLGDVFDIQKTTLKPDRILTRMNGKNALFVGVSLKNGGNIIKLGKEVKKKLKEFGQNGTSFDIAAFQSDYVQKLVGKFLQSLFESVFFIFLIVFLILGFKTGLIVGFIILLTVFSTFFMMEVFNIGLDKVSLSALIISLGILVDNSVVIADGILKERVFDNLEFKNHIISVSEKFKTPLFITTLTASFSFLPVFIAKSTVSEYASNIFKVIFIVLLFSWFYSITLLPFLMLKFSKGANLRDSEFFVIDFLKRTAKKSLDNSKTVILASFLIFLGSIILFYFVPKTFFPDSDRMMFEIRLNLKNGTSFVVTKNAVLKVEDYLLQNKNVENFSSFIGTSFPRYILSSSPEAEKPNFGMILVNLKKKSNLNNEIKNAKNFINKNVLNTNAVVQKIPLGPPVSAPVEIRIYSDSISDLFKNSDMISKKLSEAKGVYLVKNNWGDKVLGYKIKVNTNMALMAGLLPDEIFDFLNTVYQGKILTYFNRGDIKIPVILKAEKDLVNIEDITIYSSFLNKIIPVGGFADVEPYYTYSKILRRDNSYFLTVQGWIDEKTSVIKVAGDIKPYLDNIKNLKYEFGGVIEKSKKGNKSVLREVPFAFSLIFLILIFYFNSLLKPIAAFICAFLSITGANFGLFITGAEFDFMTFLGYIALVILSANNAVILINEIKTDNKNEILRAVFSRIKPILLTSLTTICGMTPLWIKNDPMFSTLAISFIFGLLASIIFTILFLPSLYLNLLGIKNNFGITNADDGT